MEQRRDIAELLAAFRAGDPAAAAELHALCAPLIRATVRRHLNPRLRPRFDSLDFEQDVWASFLAAPPEPGNFASPEAVKLFLARVAYNKVIEVIRQRFRSQKQDIDRESTTPLGAGGVDPPAPAATPSQWAIAGEEWERLLGKLPPGHRAVAERLREGHDLKDIAQMTNISLTTVNRIVRRLKDRTGL